jgi:hypothetical protein
MFSVYLHVCPLVLASGHIIQPLYIMNCFPARRGEMQPQAVAELLCHSSWPVRWAAAAALIQLDPGKLPSFGSCQSSQNMRSHQPLSPVPSFRVAIQNAVKLQAQSDQRFVRDVAKHLSSMDLTGQKCQMLCSQALLVASKLQEKKRGRDSEQSRNARSSSQARHKRDKFQKLAPSSLVLDLTS